MRFIREREDRSKMREKFWDLAGSKMGNLLKINKEAEKQENAVGPVQMDKLKPN
jgi:hypothetical protein